MAVQAVRTDIGASFSSSHGYILYAYSFDVAVKLQGVHLVNIDSYQKQLHLMM
jgi:hypothetical protein